MLNAIAFVQVAGDTPEARQAFAQQMAVLGRQLSYLLPPPVALDTMGGYLTWRNFSTVALVYTIWALLAGTGAARGDEERGQTEAWLAGGISRVRWLLTRVAGFAIVSAASVAVAMGATAPGAIIGGEPLSLGGTVLEGIDIYALTLVGFAFGLAIAQLVLTRGSAASLGAAAIVALYTVNSAVRSGGELGVLTQLSPFYHFDRSTPLLTGHETFDPVAILALVGAAAVLVVFATVAFARRDLGGSILRLRAERTRPTVRPARDPMLRVPVLAIVAQQREWAIGWAVALCGLAYFLISIARTMIDSLSAIPTMRAYFARAGLVGYSDFIGVIWFGTALLILSALVIVQVNGWAADDGEGRLESVLAAGASRSRVVLERIGSLLVLITFVAGSSAAVVGLAARAFDIPVATDRLAVATLLMLPVAFAFAGVGHLLVGWRPRVAVILLSIVAMYSYFVLQFAAVFDWPEWLTNSSVFSLYGQPMTNVDWGGAVALVAIGAFGTTAALVAMRRRDVGA
jgi:ABC-2 type transport system permease protein